MTPSGEQLYTQCASILRSVEDVRNGFQSVSSEVKGLIGLTTFDTLGREALAPLVAEFRDRYPGTQIALSISNQNVDLYSSPYDYGCRLLIDMSIFRRADAVVLFVTG